MNFIEELYLGNLSPQDKPLKKSKDFRKSFDKLVENEELLCKKLSGDDKKLFQEYVDCYGRVLTYTDTESFVTGFKIGAKLIYDTFFDADDLLTD